MSTRVALQSPSHPERIQVPQPATSPALPMETPHKSAVSPNMGSSTLAARMPIAEELLLACTGEETLDDISSVEIIFTEVPSLGGALKRCRRLERISLSDTKLKSMTVSRRVGFTESLQSLSLVKQSLVSIGELYLPNLKELMLQDNCIEVIENLEGCPKLQRLWLNSNRIKTIQNLHPLGDLRELWLQCNHIRTLGGLDHLGVLRELNLAGNKIADFKELQCLGGLPNLRDLRLRDEIFGACPVTRGDGYRNFVLCVAKQLLTLDEQPVQMGDRKLLMNTCNASLIQRPVDVLRREHEAKMVAIEARQKRNEGHAETLQKELLVAFNELNIVKKVDHPFARSKEANEAPRFKHKPFKDQDCRFEEQYVAIIDEQIRKEEAMMKEEERAFERIAHEAKFEQEEALLMSQVSFNVPTDGDAKQSGDAPFIVSKVVKGDYVSSQSAELRNIAVVLASAQADVIRTEALGISPGDNMIPVFTRSCGVLRSTSLAASTTSYCITIIKGCGAARQTDMLLERDGSGINARKLFVSFPVEDAQKVLLHGLEKWRTGCQSSESGLLLLAIPELQFLRQLRTDVSSGGASADEKRHRVVAATLLGRTFERRLSSPNSLNAATLLSGLPDGTIAAG